MWDQGLWPSGPRPGTLEEDEGSNTMDERFPQQAGPVPPDSTAGLDETDAALRERALKHLKDKRDLQAHLVAYVTVNLLLVGIWWVTTGGSGAFFWPIFPILGWGIGVAFNVWEVMSPEPGPEQVRAEMDRMRHRHA